jgi:ABC-2 type transport system permease protein
MNVIWVIVKKEVSYFFSSLIGTIVLTIFLGLNALFLWLMPINEFLHIPTTQYASLEPLFSLAPWMYLFLIPAITMRTLSEEKSLGTLELLLTKPIQITQLIVAKFLACVVILLLSLLPTLVYVFSVYNLGYPEGNLDIGGTVGSYIGLFLLGTVFISIGIFASSLAKNQITALLIAVLLCVTFYLGMDWIASFGSNNQIGYIIQHIGIQEHYNSISKGLIELKDIVYFIGASAIFITLTKLSISSSKWD